MISCASIRLTESGSIFFSGKQVKCTYFCVLIIDCFGYWYTFAVDSVVWRTVSQLFTGVLATCISMCYGVIVNNSVVCPEVTMWLVGCESPRTDQLAFLLSFSCTHLNMVVLNV